MNDETNYQNSPLHGLSLKNLLIELENHYGFEILFAYLNINCFKTNPSIESSVKFLKKTDWAREKVEAFYLYQFKSLPRASNDQFELPPRDRVIPEGQQPGPPAELSLEDAERLREKRQRKASDFSSRGSKNRGGNSRGTRDNTRGRGHSGRGDKPRSAARDSAPAASDPWAKWKENNSD